MAGAHSAASATSARVTTRPSRAMACVSRSGRRGLTKSRVIRVDEEFSAESTLDMIAASRPARIRPARPAGAYSATRRGNTASGRSRSVNRAMAITPGSTIRNSGSSLSSAASTAPRPAAPISRAPSRRWLTYWFMVQ